MGATTLRVVFHAAANGQGEVVGTAEVSAVVKEDGLLEKPSGASLGEVATDGRVDSVVIAADPRMVAGETKTFTYTAYDASEKVLAVSPGSFVAQSNNADILMINADGSATGKRMGTAQITVTIDGKRAASTITVDAADSIAIKTLPLKTRRLVYSPLTKRLYAAVAADDPAYANRIVAIDPTTGSITDSVPIGNDPSTIEIGKDGRTIYIGLKGDGSVRRFDAQTGEAGATFSLGSVNGRPQYAEDIAIHPTAPDTVAVSVAVTDRTPRHNGVFVFDNGLARPIFAKGQFSNNRIEWSEQADVIYGVNTELAEWGIHKLKVTAQGVEQTEGGAGLYPGHGDIVYERGWIYMASGAIIDAAKLQVIGQLRLEQRTHPIAVMPQGSDGFAISDIPEAGTKKISAFSGDALRVGYTQTIQTPISGRAVQMVLAGYPLSAITTDAGYVAIIDLAKLKVDPLGN